MSVRNLGEDVEFPASITSVPGVVGLLAVAAGVIVLAAGCGPGSQEDPCRDVSCTYGVCDPSTGSCVNAESCTLPDTNAPRADAGMASMQGDAGTQGGVSKSECLRGYRCVAGSCEAEVACTQEEGCQRGFCLQGACVNPGSCEADNECVRGYFCGGSGECKRDKCAGVDCERGVCDRASGKCVDREVCPSPEGEPPACLEGHKCYGDACYSKDELCQELDCQRGVCSFEALDCVNPDSCQADEDCVDGHFCNDAGTCEQNKCDANMKMCDRGVCDPKTGACANPPRCTASSDCLPMNLCVERTCVGRTDACREGGCPGNQQCDYNADSLTASCVEDPRSGCSRALDCVDDRVCQNGSCAEPTPCSGDAMEPNNSESEATGYFEVAESRGLDGSICPGDTDVFRFDTAKDKDFRGRFLVNLGIEPVDVGIGTLDVTLVGPDGSTVAEATTDASGTAMIDARFGAGSTGVYTIVVEDSGDTTTSGVRYSLFADIISKTVSSACQNAEVLDTALASGSTRTGESVALDASCVSDGPSAAENIYEFTLQEDSFVEVRVTPRGQGDLTVSLRRSCAVLQSEESCVNRNGRGQAETLKKTLQKGTYYLVVQAPKQGEGGSYDLAYTTQSVVCTSADNRCVDSSTAKICNPRGTKLQNVTCDNGCDSQRGVCRRPPGDVCYAAVDATSGLSGHQVNLGGLKNEFDPGSGSCSRRPTPHTDGPDSVFEVAVKPDHALVAKAQFGRSNDGALYLTRSCGSAGSSCIASADTGRSDERLVYRNDGQQTEKLYLVVDTEASSNVQNASVDIAVNPLVCSPGKTSCGGANVEVCNDAGTAKQVKSFCPFDCKNAQCTADTCASAFDVTGGGSWTFSPNNASADYNLGYGTCIDDSMQGKDMVFKVDLQPKEVVRATVEELGSWGNPGIYIVSDCSSTSTQTKTCLDGDNESTGGKDTAVARAPNNSKATYYIVVDNDYSTGASSGKWKLDVNVQAPICTPGTTSCQGSNLQYCDRVGLSKKTYRCQGSNPGCTTASGQARCKTPTGEQCVDPVVVKPGQTVSGDFSGRNTIELPDGSIGQCNTNNETDGDETIYQIGLDARDLLRVDLQTGYDDAQMYVMKNCLEPTSCTQFKNASKGGTLLYQTSQKETVFVVIDSDSGQNGSYSATFNVTPNAQCIPGSTSCAGSNQVAQCNSTGSRYAWRFTCPAGCTNGTCGFSQKKADNCSTAPSIGNGTVAKLDMDQYSDTVDLPRSGCSGDDSPGHDAIFKVQATAGQTIVMRAESRESGDNPMIYLTKGCSNAAKSCVAGSDARTDGNPESLRYQVPPGQGGAYYVFFDGEADYDTSEIWDVSVRVASPVCQSGTVAGCNQAGDGIRYCAGDGLSYENYACGGPSNACRQGRCADPRGGQCFDVVPVKAGDTEQGSFAGTNAVDLKSGTQGNCKVGSRTDGHDTIYGISLQQNDLLKVDLTTKNNDAQLYVLGNCKNPKSCRQFGSASNGGTLYHRAKQNGPAYIVVDSSQPSSGSFSVSFDVTPNATCRPNQASCATSNKVAMCNSDGSGYLWGGTCPSGCTAGECDFTVAQSNVCSKAPAIGRGTITALDMSKYSDNVTLSNSDCTGDGSPGHEAVFNVQANGGDVLQIDAESRGNGDNPMIYVSRSCTNVAGACVAGTDRRRDGQPESLTYVVPQGMGGNYYVFVDAEADYDSVETWDVKVRSQKTICKPGQPVRCKDSSTLEYCNLLGTATKTKTCAGSSTPTCQSGGCTNPDGDICADAIDVTSYPSTLSMKMGSQSNYIDLRHNSCVNDAGPGYDGIYRVRAAAGQTISVDVQSTNGGDNPMAYILEDCAATARTRHQGCVAGSDSSPDGQPESLSWTVPSSGGGVYYVVVDAEADYDSSGTFKTTIDVK